MSVIQVAMELPGRHRIETSSLSSASHTLHTTVTLTHLTKCGHSFIGVFWRSFPL